jgi:hypothetical protein
MAVPSSSTSTGTRWKGLTAVKLGRLQRPLHEVDVLAGNLDAFLGKEDAHAAWIGRRLGLQKLHGSLPLVVDPQVLEEGSCACKQSVCRGRRRRRKAEVSPQPDSIIH